MSTLKPRWKYNPLTATLYNRYLRYRTRHIGAFVFVATTGRSGSATLTRVFQAADRAVSTHEPYPILTSPFPPRSDDCHYLSKVFWRIKRINIHRAALGHRYYIETNHQFIKRFCEAAVCEFYPRIRVVHLVRDPVSVATSFHAIGSIPGKTESGIRYLLDPHGPDNVLDPRNMFEPLDSPYDDFARCLWYWYETEARIARFRTNHPELIWARIRTDQLNRQPSLHKLFNDLTLTYDATALPNLATSHENVKTTRKRGSIDSNLAIDLDEHVRQHLQALYGDAVRTYSVIEP